MTTSREDFEETLGLARTERSEKWPEKYHDFEVQARWETWQACDAHWREECLKEWSGLVRNPHHGQEIKPNDVLIDWQDLLKLKNAEKRLREKLQSELGSIMYKAGCSAKSVNETVAAISKEMGV